MTNFHPGAGLSRLAVFFGLELALLLILAATRAQAGDLDTIGLTALRARQPSLNGAGVFVGHPESGDNTPAFEVNPAAVGQPEMLFSWASTNGVATNFPNSLGTESGHADDVAAVFYGRGSGVAPGVSHVENDDADFFIQNIISSNLPITAVVVNQSFIDPNYADQLVLDSAYDDYVDLYGTIFCSSAGNGGTVFSPSTAYNSIAVGAYGVGAETSTGPTLDNGRSKPDLTAPGVVTSFSTPYVSGAATLLVQAAQRGDGGPNTAAAADVRTIKALLLNGAIKPSTWSHSDTAPLDFLYGAGLLNVNNSYSQLAAGQQSFSVSDTSSAAEFVSPIVGGQGWDFQTLSNILTTTVHHYCFDVRAASNRFTFTATLDWNRASGASNADQLTLTLCNVTNAAIVAQSVSTVDNLQHLYVPNLAPGQYDLQVARLPYLLTPDTYALAWQFYPISPPSLSFSSTSNALTLSWPATPTIYNLQQATSLQAPISWSAVTNAQWLTNGFVVVILAPPTNAAAFYRLIQ